MSAEQLVVDEDKLTNPLGRALFAGRLVATLESVLTGNHVTVQFQAKARPASGGRWRTMPWHLASHVFIDIPASGDDGFNDKVGTLYPAHSHMRWAGHLFIDQNADPARVWAARKILQIAQGLEPMVTDQYRLRLATHCLRCGRELTEPESITALMGPTCRGIVSKEYGQRHQAKARAIVAQGPPQMPVPFHQVADGHAEDGAEVHPQLPITIEPGSDLAALVEEWGRS